jgi:hypothetical protein
VERRREERDAELGSKDDGVAGLGSPVEWGEQIRSVVA